MPPPLLDNRCHNPVDADPVGFGDANSGGFEPGYGAQDLTVGHSGRIDAFTEHVDGAAFGAEHNVATHIHDLESGHILVELPQDRHLLIEDASSRRPEQPNQGGQGLADKGCVGTRRLLHVPSHRVVAEHHQHENAEHQTHHHRKCDVAGNPRL